MGTLRDLGAIDLTPQPCGHVGPHGAVRDRWNVPQWYLGYTEAGAGERCDHFVTNLSPFRHRDQRTGPTRWWIDCVCDWDWHDATDAACLAMFTTHRDNELTLAAAYLPENVEPPYKDAP